jgi:hypothetical protein
MERVDNELGTTVLKLEEDTQTSVSLGEDSMLVLKVGISYKSLVGDQSIEFMRLFLVTKCEPDALDHISVDPVHLDTI